MNVVLLIGRLVAQPELKHTGSNIPVCSIRIAVDRLYKDAQGNKVTDFIDVVAWRQQAEFLAKYIDKGRLVAVQGTLQVRTYTAQDGTNRKITEVVASSIQPLDKRQNTDDQPTIPAIAPDPFGATEGIPDWSSNSTSQSDMDFDPFSEE